MGVRGVLCSCKVVACCKVASKKVQKHHPKVRFRCLSDVYVGIGNNARRLGEQNSFCSCSVHAVDRLAF